MATAVARHVLQLRQEMNTAGLSPSEQEKTCGDNAAELLNILITS
jgi:predicted TIM-barrel fold metal-dependent hydrolase